MQAGDNEAGGTGSVRQPRTGNDGPIAGIVRGLAAGTSGIVDRLGTASFWVRGSIAFVAGALSVLAMAPFFLAPVMALTLPLLVWLIDTADVPRIPPGETAPVVPSSRDVLRRAAFAGWFFGFGYFVSGLFWIGEAFLVEAEKFAWLLPAAVTLLPAFLALFFAAAAAGARAVWRPGLARVVVLALALAIAEWLRGHILTGLPWNVLGYALTAPGAAIQGAAMFGIYGLTLVAVIALAAPLVSLSDAAEAPSEKLVVRAGAGALVAVALLAPLLGYGAWRLGEASDDTVDGVKLRIVQPSVPQREKWQREKQREIFDLHLDLSRRNAGGLVDDMAGVTHLVWPEAAMPFLPLESPQALSEIAELLPDGTHLLTGALRAERPEQPVDQAEAVPPPRARVFNSLMVFNAEGGLAAVYDKIHLVPFGEYLPMQALLESIGLEQLTRVRGGFEVGRTPRPIIDVPGLPPLLGLVCYEAIFPAEVVQAQDRPAVIFNVTNDGWFGQTTGPYQHFHMSRVRAVEEGVPIIRAANNGVSAVIDAYGRVGPTLDLDVRGVIDTELPRHVEPPLYAIAGDFVFLALLALLAAALALSRPSGA